MSQQAQASYIEQIGGYIADNPNIDIGETSWHRFSISDALFIIPRRLILFLLSIANYPPYTTLMFLFDHILFPPFGRIIYV